MKRKLITDLPEEVPGFKIGLAILAEYHKTIKILEIPIEFRDRDFGKSKMTKGVVYDYLRQLGGLVRTRIRR